MRKMRMAATKAGVVLVLAVLLGGVSIVYGVARFTGELPASFVAIEATFDLTIIGEDRESLGALDFGEVVQGDIAAASFGVRNDGNTTTRLGFRVRTGDANGTIYTPAARCALPEHDRAQESDRALPPDIAEELRRHHAALHEELGEIDTEEERVHHEQFHREMEERIRHLLGEQDRPQIRIAGQRIDIPGVASLCFVVAPQNEDRRPLLPPGGGVPVAVVLEANPDVTLGRHDLTILAQDRSEPTR